MATTETRHFRMHEKLLFDVIKRQAGTLSKAVLEGIMNAVDAKAARCDITLTATNLIIEDDGQGITERKHIELWFEQFGTPHEESEGKTYGTFRIGRGQLMSYGVNTWRTGRFQMDVDIKNRGLDYTLTDKLAPVMGSRVEVPLYDKLYPSQLQETQDTIEQWVKYSPIPVFWNEKLISRTVLDDEWDHVTDEAYIKLRETGDLKIYNLGIHVMDYGNYRLGVGGVVVSRQQLKVNFARNDVQSDCEVWQKIRPFLDNKATETLQKTPSLDDGGRRRLCDKLRTGDLKEWRTPKLFTAVNGRQYAFDNSIIGHKYGCRVSNAPKGHLLANRLFDQQTAFILADETLERFKVETVPELLKLLKQAADKVECGHRVGRQLDKVVHVPFSELAAGFDSRCLSLAQKEWTPNEQVWQQLITHVKQYIVLPTERESNSHYDSLANERQILIGESDAAAGWTDGVSYVAIGREFLRKQDFNVEGFCNVVALLIHELCHGGPDTAEHNHTHEFYETFHDTAYRCLGNAVARCLSKLPLILEQQNRRESKAALRDLDRLEKLERTLAG